MADMDVRDEEIEAQMKELGQRIGGALPPGWGFALEIFKFGKDGATFYISNARRDDMIAVLKGLLGRLEHKPDGSKEPQPRKGGQ